MKRIALLDYGRFVACLAVLMYHYFYNGIRGGKITSIVEIEPLVIFAKYGLVGVPFFFMISGYVIFFSLHGKSASDFLYSRIKRLYPSYWFAVIFTSFFILLWGRQTPMVFTLNEFLINLTMLQKLFDVKNIDGVYWTLIYELKFYFAMFLFAMFLSKKWLLRFFKLWPVLLLVALIANKGIFIFHIYYSFFSLGVLFAIFQNSKTWDVILPMLLVAGLCFYKILKFGVTPFEKIIYGLIMVMLVVYFWFLIQKRWQSVSLPYSNVLGELTYPVYLIHAHFGYLFLSRYATEQNKWIIYVVVIGIVFAVSYFMIIFIEKKGSPFWRKIFYAFIQPVKKIEEKLKFKYE